MSPLVISHVANDCRSLDGDRATIASRRAPSRLPFVSGIAAGSAALMLISHALRPSNVQTLFPSVLCAIVAYWSGAFAKISTGTSDKPVSQPAYVPVAV